MTFERTLVIKMKQSSQIHVICPVPNFNNTGCNKKKLKCIVAVVNIVSLTATLIILNSVIL